jgi:hypothetical protein
LLAHPDAIVLPDDHIKLRIAIAVNISIRCGSAIRSVTHC